MAKKPGKVYHVMYDYNETEVGVQTLLDILRSMGVFVYELSKDSGSTFTHYVVSDHMLSQKKLKEMQKEAGWVEDEDEE